MSKYSSVKNGFVEHDFFLIFDGASSVRLSRQEPDLARAERAMFIRLKAPMSLWSKPLLRGSIEVRSDGAPANTVIDVRVAESALREALGVDIDLQVIPPEVAP